MNKNENPDIRADQNQPEPNQTRLQPLDFRTESSKIIDLQSLISLIEEPDCKFFQEGDRNKILHTLRRLIRIINNDGLELIILNAKAYNKKGVKVERYQPIFDDLGPYLTSVVYDVLTRQKESQVSSKNEAGILPATRQALLGPKEVSPSNKNEQLTDERKSRIIEGVITFEELKKAISLIGSIPTDDNPNAIFDSEKLMEIIDRLSNLQASNSELPVAYGIRKKGAELANIESDKRKNIPPLEYALHPLIIQATNLQEIEDALTIIGTINGKPKEDGTIVAYSAEELIQKCKDVFLNHEDPRVLTSALGLRARVEFILRQNK